MTDLLKKAEVASTALIYQIVDPSGDILLLNHGKNMEELRLH